MYSVSICVLLVAQHRVAWIVKKGRCDSMRCSKIFLALFEVSHDGGKLVKAFSHP
jgi:hypothetical protein